MADSVEAPATDVSPYLKQVRVRDYPPLRDAKVNFKPGLNIIIGKNGAGKTRFVNLASHLVNAFQEQTVGAGCELIINFGGNDIGVSFYHTLPTEEENIFRPYQKEALKVAVSSGKKKAKSNSFIDALVEVNASIPFYKVVLAKHGTPLQQLPLADIPATIVFNNTLGVTVESGLEQGDFSEWPLLSGAILDTIRVLYNWQRRGRKGPKPPAGISVKTARAEVERAIQTYLAFLNPILLDYSPIREVRLSTAYQVYDNKVQQEIVVKGLVLEYRLTDDWLPFTTLSDGTKRLLYLISQLIIPRAGFRRSKERVVAFTLHNPTSIIFLEEPELGIHHSQLHKLLQLIREVSSERQVIMTTHAPQVLDMLGADELDRITICSLDPEKGTQFHKLTEEKQEQARVYMKEVGFLSDYWRYSYLEETEAE